MTISCGPVIESHARWAGHNVVLYTCACRKVQGTVVASELYAANAETRQAKAEHARQSLQALHDQVEDPLS